MISSGQDDLTASMPGKDHGPLALIQSGNTRSDRSRQDDSQCCSACHGSRACTNNVHSTAKTMELLRFENKKPNSSIESLKLRFQYGSILLENHGLDADFNNRNNTRFYHFMVGRKLSPPRV